MKALVYTAPHTIELQELPQPEIAPDEVLLKIKACGVCGSDMHGYHGRSKKRVPPLVLGHEFSGEIVNVGEDVTDFKPGDRVAVYPLITCGVCRWCLSDRHHLCPERKIYGLDFHGALAEYTHVPQECLFSLPGKLSFAEGALVEPLANALHVIDMCGDVKDSIGVIYGAGSIGLLVYLAAKLAGAKQMAMVDVNPLRLKALQALGADLLIDASQQDVVGDINRWTDGTGADFTVDAVGNQPCRTNALETTCRGGVSVWIGLEEDEFTLSGLSIVNREIEIKGSYAYSRQDFNKALTLLASGEIPTEKFISNVTLESGSVTFAEIAGGKSPIMKAIFNM